MKLLKFGGKSLANGKGLENVLAIIKNKIKEKERIVVVVSARGYATDLLEQILEYAKQGKEYTKDWEDFKSCQLVPNSEVDYSKEFSLLEQIFQGVRLVEDYSPKVKDLVLAQGELLSAKMIATLLEKEGIQSIAVDSRKLLKTDSCFGQAHILGALSEQSVQAFWATLTSKTVPIITGFIASNEQGETTTLGRNGSNYTASLFANYLNVEEVESYTHLNGIYTANPDQVVDAQIIKRLNFQEAGELASFGAFILHAKTIMPLIEKNIPLRILNTFNADATGTLISTAHREKGVKAITVQDDICIISIAGKGFLGKKGIDARIFKTLSDHDISVGVVSQGSSERGVDFLINEAKAEIAVAALQEEFAKEFFNKDVSSITAIKDVAVVTIIGQDLQGFTMPYQALVKNGICTLLINNTLNGKNIGLVLPRNEVLKAMNVIHGQIFGVAKKINIAIFGKGKVGGSLIDQIQESKAKILEKKGLALNTFAIAGKDKVVLDRNGIGKNWRTTLTNTKQSKSVVRETIAYAQKYHLENLIAIDNTASDDFVTQYISLVLEGFDLISSNKKANTQSFSSYKELRKTLQTHNKHYLYETNVGAGLPLIDTIKLLHSSGENITRIRGVFSGSLSYLFNQFSVLDRSFSSILKEAIEKGYTEPDAREDLCGNDVARKLLILARELDLENELEDIFIENLIPESLRKVSLETFMERLDDFNSMYNKLKSEQLPQHALRYVGDLAGDLQKRKGELSVRLVSVPQNSALGQLKAADSIFEIYTESYGENPIVIQGAGAGAEVTARGVFGDLLRITDKK